MPTTPKGSILERGFTLLELMIVVAIIGILASLAVPSFMKYLYKAKTSEADEQLKHIADGARTYYMDRSAAKGTVQPIPPQFPVGVALTPSVTCCQGGNERCAPVKTEWEVPSWEALHFEMSDPHYYRYIFESAGQSITSTFTARAHGDLDCDGDISTFETSGRLLFQGSDITFQGGFWRFKRLE